MAKQHFENVREDLMPGETRAAFEALTRGFDQLAPGFRDMLYQLLDERFCYHSKFGEGSFKVSYPKPYPRACEDYIAIAHLFPGYEEQGPNVNWRRLLMHMKSTPMVCGRSRADQERHLTMEWSHKKINEWDSDLTVGAALYSGNLSFNRTLSFTTRAPFTNLVRESRRKNLDEALAFQFGEKRFHKVIRDSVAQARNRMKVL